MSYNGKIICEVISIEANQIIATICIKNIPVNNYQLLGLTSKILLKSSITVKHWNYISRNILILWFLTSLLPKGSRWGFQPTGILTWQFVQMNNPLLSVFICQFFFNCLSLWGISCPFWWCLSFITMYQYVCNQIEVGLCLRSTVLI